MGRLPKKHQGQYLWSEPLHYIREMEVNKGASQGIQTGKVEREQYSVLKRGTPAFMAAPQQLQACAETTSEDMPVGV